MKTLLRRRWLIALIAVVVFYALFSYLFRFDTADSSSPVIASPTAAPEPQSDSSEAEPSDDLDHAGSSGALAYVSGPETAGSVINIAGTEIQLPQDAWVKSRIASVYCIAGQVCPTMPLLVIARGGKTIEIDGDGDVLSPDAVASDPGFRFLLEALDN